MLADPFASIKIVTQQWPRQKGFYIDKKYWETTTKRINNMRASLLFANYDARFFIPPFALLNITSHFIIEHSLLYLHTQISTCEHFANNYKLPTYASENTSSSKHVYPTICSDGYLIGLKIPHVYKLFCKTRLGP